MDRRIEWPGFHNARDLGGLPAAGGRVTRRRALIRSADLRFVTAAGWQAAYDAGVRTVVDLRNDDEVEASSPALPAGVRRVRVPLDGVEDTEFWKEHGAGTPLYYRPFLDRKSDRCAAAVTAVARAAPGGVIFHCGAGRDRTGLVAMLVLGLAGVPAQVIADDYEMSTEPLRSLFAALGRADEGPIIERILAKRGTTARALVLEVLAGFDAEAYLLAAGVAGSDLDALRTRTLAGA
jgi:protein-tyrosine phosphatase